MGVWIETAFIYLMYGLYGVTPCVGVWIETSLLEPVPTHRFVTPCVGVWIETILSRFISRYVTSHPAWVCGLKNKRAQKASMRVSHTLRGCVD